jgi:hypothetical protein
VGLYYYGYRHYAPHLGRWLSRDPIEEQGGLNLYGSFMNAPILQIDPTGHGPWPRRKRCSRGCCGDRKLKSGGQCVTLKNAKGKCTGTASIPVKGKVILLPISIDLSAKSTWNNDCAKCAKTCNSTPVLILTSVTSTMEVCGQHKIGFWPSQKTVDYCATVTCQIASGWAVFSRCCMNE